MSQSQHEPRILIYDIETSPIVSWNWGIYDQNAIEVIQDWQIICFAYKWLGEKKTTFIAQWDYKGHKDGWENLNDKQVVEYLHNLFNQADIVVAHNGDQFDQKKVQARMMVHGMSPPSPYKQIDTKKLAKRPAAHTSNKLTDLGKAFNLGVKEQTGGFATWKGCMSGDEKARKIMKKYNIQDVELLEKLYLYLRPWATNHPHMGYLAGRPDACRNCGGTHIQSKGVQRNNTNEYRRFKCMDCGAPLRGRLAEKSEKPIFV